MVRENQVTGEGRTGRPSGIAAAGKPSGVSGDRENDDTEGQQGASDCDELCRGERAG